MMEKSVASLQFRGLLWVWRVPEVLQLSCCLWAIFCCLFPLSRSYPVYFLFFKKSSQVLVQYYYVFIFFKIVFSAILWDLESEESNAQYIILLCLCCLFFVDQSGITKAGLFTVFVLLMVILPQIFVFSLRSLTNFSRDLTHEPGHRLVYAISNGTVRFLSVFNNFFPL